MNKKLIFCFIEILFLFLIVFIGCENEKTYLVRAGGLAAGISYPEKGVFVSPNESLVPYFIEDDVRETKTISEVENLLKLLKFDQNWIQSVKNNLNKYGSAFVSLTYAGYPNNYDRWMWITEN
jgi:hypothetical protein